MSGRVPGLLALISLAVCMPPQVFAAMDKPTLLQAQVPANHDHTAGVRNPTVTVRIRLEEPPADGIPIELLNDSDTEMAIVVPQEYRPALTLPRNLRMTRTSDGHNVKFTFVVEPGVTAKLERGSNEINLTLVGSEPLVAGGRENTARPADSSPGALDGQTTRALPVMITQGAGRPDGPDARTMEESRAVDPVEPRIADVTPKRAAPAGAPTNAAPAAAQNPEPLSFFSGLQTILSAQGPIDQANLDLGVPESPAFTVLGVTPENVIRPSSPQMLATSLLSGVDKNGNFQAGIALDTVPYLLFAGRAVTLDRYRNSYVTRLFSRLELSLATAKGASDADKSTRLAVGFRLTPWDKGDPRMDTKLTECIQTSLARLLAGIPPVPPNTTTIPPDIQNAITLAQTQAIQAVLSCRQQARKDNWNRSSWTIGMAPSWISPAGTVGALNWDGGGFWTSLAYGFEGVPGLEKAAQLILHARYRTRETLPDPTQTGQFFVQDSAFFGGRLRAGTPDFAVNFEGGYSHNMPIGGVVNNTYTLSFAGERRVSKNLWFEISIGGQGGLNAGKNNTFVLTSFKWDFSREPQLGLPPR